MVVFAALLGCGTKSEPGPAAARETGPETSQPAPSFREVRVPALDTCRFRNGREAGMTSILEIVGGGVACFDYDADGLCDLYFAGGGTIDPDNRRVEGVAGRLMRGEARWDWRPVEAEAGAVVDSFYTHGASVADFNHDGWPDMLVYGYRDVRLLRNQGDGTFRDVTRSAGLGEAPWTTGAAWGDLDRDGILDLYLASYVEWNFDTHNVCPAPDGAADVCSPNAFAGSRDHVYLGSADGRFIEIPHPSGRMLEDRALGVVAARLSEDPAIHFAVTNDLSANYLLRLNDQGNLAESGVAAGIAVDRLGNPNGSMGIAVTDLQNDGRFDLVVTNFEHEEIAYYRNLGGLTYRHASRDVGLSTLQARVVGFGVVASDFDGDGWEDVLLTSGHVHYHPDRGEMPQEPLLLVNRRGERLSRVIPSCDYFRKRRVGRSLATADLDRDGDADVLVTHLLSPPVVLENVSGEDAVAGSGSQPHWLALRLVGRDSPRTPIGAVAEVTVGERTLYRQQVGGGSYLAHSESELLVRWPADPGDRGRNADSADVVVSWPSGRQSRINDVQPNRRILIVEPRTQQE